MLKIKYNLIRALVIISMLFSILPSGMVMAADDVSPILITITNAEDFNGTYNNTEAIGDSVKLSKTKSWFETFDSLDDAWVVTSYNCSNASVGVSSGTLIPSYGNASSIWHGPTITRILKNPLSNFDVTFDGVYVGDTSSDMLFYKLELLDVTDNPLFTWYYVDSWVASGDDIKINNCFFVDNLEVNKESKATFNDSVRMVRSGNTITFYRGASAIYSGICNNTPVTKIRINWHQYDEYVTPPTSLSGVFFSGMEDFLSSGTYTHIEQDVSGAGVVNNATITFNKTTPTNTSCSIEVNVYNGSSWSGWTEKNSGDTIITSGTDLTGYKVQWRANLSTTESTVTPSLDDVTISINRGENANLSNLTISSGTLEPAFGSDTMDYVAAVENAIETITVTPTVEDANATLIVTSNDSEISGVGGSYQGSLNTGDNTIAIEVTAEDGVTKNTYNITITRAEVPASNNANLSALVISSGTLDPAFGSDTMDYVATVENAIETITVTPTVEDANATLIVTSNDSEISGVGGSYQGSLNTGDNTIAIEVTAEDGVTKNTYNITITKQTSTNANLANVIISSGTLDPAFNSDTTNYTAAVRYEIQAITVMPVPEDAHTTQTVTINGSEIPEAGGSYLATLNLGENTITIKTTAEDGITTKTYNITINRSEVPTSTNANLASITIDNGIFEPKFYSYITDYVVRVSENIETAAITAIPEDEKSNLTIIINGSETAGEEGSYEGTLKPGDNIVTIKVMAEDEVTTKTYTLLITDKVSDNAKLFNLTIDNGTLEPAFNRDITNYTVAVTNAIQTISVIPTLEGANASLTVTINGAEIAGEEGSYQGALNVGVNAIALEVMAEDGITKNTYTVNITRAEPSEDADLSDITIDSGGSDSDEPDSDSPDIVFNSDTTNYTANVSNKTETITFTPNLKNANSSIKVSANGSIVPGVEGSYDVPLNTGDNIISIEITAEDGSVKTYTITLTRALTSNNANLSNLIINNGTLAPVFNRDITNYTALVSNAIEEITVTPIPEDAKASLTVTINGSETTGVEGSYQGYLNPGDNIIAIEVRAEDGETVKTYTTTLTRALTLNNANLFNLIIDNGTLAPVFDRDITNYTALVSNAIEEITVTPIPEDAKASLTVTINGSETTGVEGSYQGYLNPGDNIIAIEVRAEDGKTVKTYTTTLTRALTLNNANLFNLIIDNGTLAPVFDRDITNYTALVSNAIEEITVTPIPEDAKASLTVTINGSEMVGVEGNYQGTLNTGVNNIAIEVTAEDGETVKTYTITLTRVSISNNANLSNLIIDNGTLAPVFNRDITNYMALVSNAIEEITVTPILEDAKASLTVTINGSETVGVGGNYQATLNTGVNNIAIEVTAEDGETVKTYTVNITRDKSDNANLKTLILNKGRVELGFSAQTTKYDIVVSDTVDDVTVTATSENQQATVAINGKEVANGEESWPIKLNYGDNTITVQVTAEDGTEKTHTINIYRNKISAEAPVEIKIMGEEYNSIIDKKIAIGHGDNLKIIVGIKNLAEKLSNIEEIKDLKDQDKILIQIIATERCRDLITELSGLEYQDTQTKNIIIQCETKEAVYTIPLKELDIEKIFSNMTKEDEPSDPKLVIQISQLPKEYIQNLAQDNKDKGYQILMAPIKFNIVCTNNNEVYEISRYNDYIERTVKIPEEVNPEEIATAVAINEDGSISHVPTKLTKEKGKYYLKIKSLINGTYSVISREKKFKDIQKHWAEEAINQLGTRCIVGGIDAENFDPQKEITRCEFAAILNRALGLKELPEPLPVIWDITEKDWYYQSVKISAQYGLMGGYSDGKFKPQKNITREEAMVVLARAMKLGGIQIKLNEQELERQLSQFHDSEQISEWAKESAAVNVKYGIIVGRDGLLAPKDKITRAETAVIVTRLLKRAGLI